MVKSSPVTGKVKGQTLVQKKQAMQSAKAARQAAVKSMQNARKTAQTAGKTAQTARGRSWNRSIPLRWECSIMQTVSGKPDVKARRTWRN